MAARATRSASRKARLTEAVATGPFGALSHDELGVIVDGLADPLQPVVAVALSSTCLGLRTPLLAALEVLKEPHERAKALCRKMRTTCAAARDAVALAWDFHNHQLSMSALLQFHRQFQLNFTDMATLGMILRTRGLPRLERLDLSGHALCSVGVQALCEGLNCGAAPSLSIINLNRSRVGRAGAVAFAAAIRRGALPKLEVLLLNQNPLGNQGLAAMALPLRKLPALRCLQLNGCLIGDDAVASLLANLGKDEFKALWRIDLDSNEITDAGCGTIVDALDADAMPSLRSFRMAGIRRGASSSAVQMLEDAFAKRLGSSSMWCVS